MSENIVYYISKSFYSTVPQRYDSDDSYDDDDSDDCDNNAD
jgi:hypothetical protein